VPSSAASLHFRRQGAGEPLVLLHGIGGELCVWQPVLDPLAEAFDVIAVDLPGFGRSRALPEGVTPTPAALARAVGALLDELGLDRAHVAGNSLGGWVALELAVQGRALTVTGVCPAGLWGAPVRRGTGPAPGRGQRIARRLRPVLPVALLSRGLRRKVLAPFVAEPDKVPYRAAWRMISSYARATAYSATSTAMREDHFTGADAIDVPVTLAFGDRDRLIRPTRLRTPGAESVVLAGCGHIPMWDDPDAVAGVIEATARRAAGATRRPAPSPAAARA
jgi:pimeloyl-ACP methyl ester carboxylesterase